MAGVIATHPGREELRSALTTLVELQQAEPDRHHSSGRATGFTPLDDVLCGGVHPGELLLVGGKPGVGKTVACLQWARAMAQRGVVSIYLCYEHDQATLVARLLSCELREAAMAEGRHPDLRLDELQGRLRDVAAGTLTLREALAPTRSSAKPNGGWRRMRIGWCCSRARVAAPTSSLPAMP